MNQLTVTLVVVIGLLGGFYGGFKYGQNHPPPSTSSTTPAAFAGANGGGGGTGAGGGTGGGRGAGAGGGFGGNAISGQVTAVGNGTITVHETNGTDVQVNVSSARISKTSQGTTADLLPKRPGPHTPSKRTKEVEALILRTRFETDPNM